MISQHSYNCNHMTQITIDLDDETATLLRQYAGRSRGAAGKWVAEAVRRRAASEWRPDILKMFGTWSAEDVPDAGDLRQSRGLDGRREKL